MSTWIEMINMTRSLLDAAEDDPKFTADRIQEALRVATDDLAQYCGTQLAEYTVTTSSGTTWYSIPAYTLGVRDARLQDTHQLIITTVQQMAKEYPNWQDQDSGQPTHLIVGYEQVGLHPTPDDEYTVKLTLVTLYDWSASPEPAFVPMIAHAISCRAAAVLRLSDPYDQAGLAVLPLLEEQWRRYSQRLWVELRKHRKARAD